MENVKNYLLENMDELKDVVRELNSWNGSLEHLQAWDNDESFFEMMFHGNPMEAVRSAYYGEYNYMDELVRFNGYGNMESFSEYQYEEELKDYIGEILDILERNYLNISISDELQELLEDETEESE